VRRFRSASAYARHNGTAPLPVWSGNRIRHRLSRTGNRQLNCAIHRIAVTQKRGHPDARAYLKGQVGAGHTDKEALRALKRKISDTVYRKLLADASRTTAQSPDQAA
jgi:transposase